MTTESRESTAAGGAAELFGVIFEPGDIVEIRPLMPGNEKSQAGRRWVQTDEISGRKVVKWMQAANESGHGAYFGANPRRADGGGKAEDVLLARCLFADFDGGVEVEDALARIELAGKPWPSAVVHSGGGVHLWWRLTEPITDMAAWTRCQKKLAEDIGSDPVVSDPPRLMRVPGYVNTKYEHKPTCRLEEKSGEVFDVRDILPGGIPPEPLKFRSDCQPVEPGSMSRQTRRFLEQGYVFAKGGRRCTAFTVACDLNARGWKLADAERVIMDAIPKLGLSSKEAADIPRQIANAFSKVRTPCRDGVSISTAQPAIVGEVVPYKPVRTREWGRYTVEMRWTVKGKQAVRVLDGEVVVEMAELKVATLSTRDTFTKKVAKTAGGDAAELNRILVSMLNEGCPPPPARAESREIAAPAYPDEIDGRPAVLVGGSSQVRTIALERCLSIVATEFYQADQAIVSVDVCSNRGARVVQPITVERLAAWLDSNVAFYSMDDEDGEVRMSACPDWLAKRIFKLQKFETIRPVNAIATGPFLRPDGTIGGYESGYDEQTGVVIVTGEAWARVPDRPTAAEAKAAAATLLGAVKTFPFRGSVDRSVWLASVLTTVARPAFTGPAPMFVATAPVMGSGKSLLQQAASWIAFGTDAPAAKLAADHIENEKVMGAIVATRPTCIVFDNVSGSLGDPTIDRVLTSDVPMFRLLGASKMIPVRNTFVAFANGNNLSPKGDIGRRILHMRLEPDTDRPHEVQHDGDFRSIILERRPELLIAALTILRHGMTLENPPAIRRLGSYGRWGAVVQTAIVAIGHPDPAESQGEMLNEGSDVVGELVAAIADAVPDFCDTAGRLVERAFERNQFGGGGYCDHSAACSRLREAIDAVVEQHRGGRPGRIEDVRGQVVLKVIEANRDRWFADARLVRAKRGNDGRRWKIERRGDAWESAA